MNSNKPDLATAIRLQKQVDLPVQKDILDISAETRRSKRRVELPLQPEGRPEPAILAAQYDQHTGKTSWMLYDGASEDACVVWGASDPDSSKVVQAMRDWSITARMAEGWSANNMKITTGIQSAHQSNPLPPNMLTPALSFPTLPDGTPVQAFQPLQPLPGTPAHTFPTLPQGTPAQTFAVLQPGMPPQFFTPVVGVPGVPYEQYPQPNYQQGYPAQQPWPPQPPYVPMHEGSAPGHWAHSYQQPQPQPLPPELWSAQAWPNPALKLGDVLVAAGLIPTRTLQAALTLQNSSNMERRRIGEILVNSGALPQPILQAAVRLQELARTGSLGNSRVTEVLIRMHSTGETLEQALSPADPAPKEKKSKTKTVRPSDELLEREAHVSDEDQKKLKHVMNLLKQLDFSGEEGTARAQHLLGLFKQAALLDQAAIESANKTTPSMADAVKSLLVKEVIDPITFAAGLDCQKLLDRKRMRPDQAIIALGYCQRSRVGIKEAISDLNWDIATDGI